MSSNTPSRSADLGARPQPSGSRRRRAASAAGRAAGLVVVLAAASVLTTLAAGASTAGPRAVAHAVPHAFKVLAGKSDGGYGFGAVTADGTYVLAATIDNSEAIAVCTMKKGATGCKTSSTLHSYKQDDLGNVTPVIATGGKDVTIVDSDCCYIPPFDGDLVAWNSTNDGKTWSKEYEVGNLDGVSSATYADGEIVAAVNGGETRLQAFEPSQLSSSSWTPLTAQAAVQTHGAEDAYVTTASNDGVLVGSDNGDSTYVYFASKTADFNKSSSYHQVGQFGHETLVALSGDAVQTDIQGGLTGNERLRIFNGTKVPSHGNKVVEPLNGDDGAFNMVDVAGVVHDFFINRRGYNIYTASTTSGGLHWTPLTVFTTGGGLADDFLSPVLAKDGTGVLFETAGSPQYAQPIGHW